VVKILMSFSFSMLLKVGYLWQLKIVIFHCKCLIQAVPLQKEKDITRITKMVSEE